MRPVKPKWGRCYSGSGARADADPGGCAAAHDGRSLLAYARRISVGAELFESGLSSGEQFAGFHIESVREPDQHGEGRLDPSPFDLPDNVAVEAADAGLRNLQHLSARANDLAKREENR